MGSDRVSIAHKLLTAAHGGLTWAKAIATGDVAPEEVTEQRRQICNACPMRTVAKLAGMDAESTWCGPPFEDHTTEADEAKRSCGCLLYGATLVASKSCPQGKWIAVPLTKDQTPIRSKE